MSNLFHLAIYLPAGMLACACAMIALGRRGKRVDLHPICRRCRYDLIGLPEGSTACSECGRDLTRRRARRIGNRHPRRGLIWAGILLLAPSLAWFGVFGWIVAHRVDVNHYKPYFVLAREAIAENQQLRENAIVELTRRLQAGKLSGAQVDALAAKAVERLALVTFPGTTPWDIFLQTARAARLLSDDKWNSYWSQLLTWEFRVREEVRLDDPIPILVTTPRLRRAPGNISPRGYYLAEQPATVKHAQWSIPTTKFDEIVILKRHWTRELTEGPQTLTCEMDVELHARTGNYEVVARPHLRAEAVFKLSSDEWMPISKLAKKEAAGSMRDCITVEKLSYAKETQELTLTMTITQAKYTLGMGVFVVMHDRPWPIARILLLPARTQSFTFTSYLPDPYVPSAVDIILEPDIESVIRTIDFKDIWGDSIVLKQIPVR